MEGGRESRDRQQGRGEEDGQHGHASAVSWRPVQKDLSHTDLEVQEMSLLWSERSLHKHEGQKLQAVDGWKTV